MRLPLPRGRDPDDPPAGGDVEQGRYPVWASLPRAPLRRAGDSGKLLALVKQHARLRALDEGADLLLVDGPPGIGCPVIAALSGADVALVVTEPTVSGAHDLDRTVDVADHFGVLAVVLVNKADLSPAQSSAIEAACAERDVAVVGRLPYDPAVTEMMVRGEPIATADGPVSAALSDVWTVVELLREGMESEPST